MLLLSHLLAAEAIILKDLEVLIPLMHHFINSLDVMVDIKSNLHVR